MLNKEFPWIATLKGRIHPQGWPFIGIAFLITILLFHLSVHLGWIGLIFTGWCAYFFRDPDRVTPEKLCVVSPADGVITDIHQVEQAPFHELTGAYTRVSVFLSVFDVHVNRLPVTGRVLASHYTQGSFRNAMGANIHEINERHALVLETPEGMRVACVQLAGLLARRISWDIHVGDEGVQGQRYGIIRFGSRVDVYVPAHCCTNVKVGQRAVAGETVLFEF